MSDEHCPKSPKHQHCWHKDPTPDYTRDKPYRHYCCWCGKEYFEQGYKKQDVPAHGQCRDGTCRETLP